MKRSILKISLLVLIPFMIIISFTSAWFYSKTVSKQNIFKAGTLIIRNPGQIVSEEEFKNICPGWRDGNKAITIINDGTLNLKCRLAIRNNNENKLYTGEYPLNMAAAYTDIDELKPMDEIKYINIGTIKKNQSKILNMTFSLPEYAGNEYQGASANMDFVFEATQENFPFNYDVPIDKPINKYLKLASDGDIVNLYGSNYKEDIVITNSVTLCGADNNGFYNKVTISPSAANTNPKKSCIEIQGLSSKVKFSNITFGGGTYGAKIIADIDEVTFENCSFEGNNIGIYLNTFNKINNLHLINCNFNCNGYIFSFGNSSLINNIDIENISFSGQKLPSNEVKIVSLNGKITNLMMNNQTLKDYNLDSIFKKLISDTAK